MGVVKLLPFFTYYGGKWRAAKHYPAPECGLIVEPFAGSAGYSLNYPEREVLLRDTDPNVVDTWRWLLNASPADVLDLPDLKPGQITTDLDLPAGARHLIGWWLNKGAERPRLQPSSFMLDHPRGGPYWGPSVRARIASQLEAVRHWRIEIGGYRDAPDLEATWFVDPPYERAGKHYRHGASGIDYAELAAWVRSRRGQIICCEADDAAWLPFRPLVTIDGTEGKQKTARARVEVIWP